MISSTVARRYAKALYDLADENGVAEKIGKDLASLAEAWKGSEELVALFQNPKFSVDDKRGVIKALAQRSGCHAITVNAAQLLSDRRRLSHLPEIAASYALISEQRSGRIRAEIVTATRLPEAYYTQLQAKLEAATGKKVALARSEDPSLIGGVVTTVGGRVFDGSIKNRLRGLRSQLLSSTDPALDKR